MPFYHRYSLSIFNPSSAIPCICLTFMEDVIKFLNLFVTSTIIEISTLQVKLITQSHNMYVSTSESACRNSSRSRSTRQVYSSRRITVDTIDEMMSHVTKNWWKPFAQCKTFVKQPDKLEREENLDVIIF